MTTEKDAEAFAETVGQAFSEIVSRRTSQKRDALVAHLVDLAASGDPRAREVAQKIRALETEGPWGTVCVGSGVKDGAIETAVDIAATQNGARLGSHSPHPFEGNVRIRFEPAH